LLLDRLKKTPYIGSIRGISGAGQVCTMKWTKSQLLLIITIATR
jgi:hypothetical protein